MKRIVAVLLLAVIASCKPQWSYSGKTGPKNWSDLDKKFKFCEIGYNQSPIDVKNFEAHGLRFENKTITIAKEKTKYTLEPHFYGESFLFRGQKKYLLHNIEFHHPSEHLISGKNYSLEMQITYKSEDNQYLKLAVFLEIGKNNEDFDGLVNFLDSKQQEMKMNFDKLIPQTDLAFFYEGSMTIPPCKEGVKWYVMKTPIFIAKEQLNRIIKSTIFVPTNARPVQKFNAEAF